MMRSGLSRRKAETEQAPTRMRNGRMRRQKFALTVCLLLFAVTGLPSCGGGGGGGGPNTPRDEVIIVPPGENHAPAVERVFEDIALTLEAGRAVHWESADLLTYFSDADNDELEYRARSNNAGVADIAFNRVGPSLIVLRVRAVSPGTARITLTAADPGGLSVTQSFTVSVVHDAAALPPDDSDTISGARDIMSGDTVEAYLDSPNDVDIFRIQVADARLIDLTLTSDESGIEIALLDGAGNVLDTAVTASEARLRATAQGGEFFVRVRALSPALRKKLEQGVRSFKIGVLIGRNVQSLINILQGKPDIDVEIGAVGGTFQLGEHFEFPAGSTGRAFKISLSVSGVTWTVEQNVLRISAAHGLTPGPLRFTVEASALALPSAFKSLQVNLIDAPNQPPKSVCDPIIQQTVDPGETATFALNACFKDDKPEELSFAVARVVESSGTGWQRGVLLADLEVTSRESMSSRDFIIVEVTATDSSGQSATQAFRVNLNMALHPVRTQILTKNLDPGGSEMIDLTAYFQDPEGSRLTFALGQIPQGITVRLTGTSLTLSADSQAGGGYTFSVTVTTDDGRSKAFDFRVNVKAPLRPLKELVIRVMADRMTTARLAEFVGFPQDVTDPPPLSFVLQPGSHANRLRATMDAAHANLTVNPPFGLQGEFSLQVKAVVVDARFAVTDFTFRVIVGDEEEELGPEWIRAQNVDCHAHRDTLVNLGIFGLGGYLPHSYSGGCSERKAHGRGIAVRLGADGSATANVRYEGDWKDGRASGQGTLVVNYRTYEGTLLDGLEHGQGTQTEADIGRHYEGQWSHGRRHGRGTVTWPGQYRYEGEWQNNLGHGQGTIIYYSDGARYVGEWYGGYWHGQGTLTRPDGYRYEGSWSNSAKHGQGTETHSNGSRYVGEWEHDRFKTGQVTIVEDDGYRFEGAYLDYRRHGQGTETFANGGGRKGEWRNGDFWNGTEREPDGSFDTYSNGRCVKTTNSDGTDGSTMHEDGTTSCGGGSIQ